MQQVEHAPWRGYSLAERDRRWQAVRDGAARAGLDAVLVPLCMSPTEQDLSSEAQRGCRADGRYLTQLETGATVLPTDGRTPLAIGFRAFRNEWLSEVRAPRGMWGSWGTMMADALCDAGLERARIGVAGVSRGTVTHVSAPHGVVNHGAFAEVLQRLPHAQFEDATDIVGFARYVKSDEELAALRRAAAISAAGIDALLALARPDVDLAQVYGAVAGRLLDLGSEYYAPVLEVGPPGGPLARFAEPPLGRRLKHGELLHCAVGAIWGGLIAEEAQTVVLGPTPDAWQSAAALQREVFVAGLERLTPGTAVGDWADHVEGLGRQGERHGLRVEVELRGRGLGDDGPWLSPRAVDSAARQVVLAAGSVFTWSPRVVSEDGQIRIGSGSTVVVTAGGGEPLVQRPREPIASASTG